MLSEQPTSPILTGLTPVGVATVLAAGLAGTVWGPEGLLAVGCGAVLTVLIYLLSEAFLRALGLTKPLERLMGGMLIRGGVAATAVAVAVLALKIEPKLVASLAMVFYGSLIVGEVNEAKRMESAAAPKGEAAGAAGGMN